LNGTAARFLTGCLSTTSSSSCADICAVHFQPWGANPSSPHMSATIRAIRGQLLAAISSHFARDRVIILSSYVSLYS
jgi:hypothetical protein